MYVLIVIVFSLWADGFLFPCFVNLFWNNNNNNINDNDNRTTTTWHLSSSFQRKEILSENQNCLNLIILPHKNLSLVTLPSFLHFSKCNIFFWGEEWLGRTILHFYCWNNWESEILVNLLPISQISLEILSHLLPS